MNTPDDKLSRLWQKARTARRETSPADETLVPGTATRIAARWAARQDSPSPAMLWERVTFVCFTVMLLALGTLFVLEPPAHEPDLMTTLFNASFEVEEAPPF